MTLERLGALTTFNFCGAMVGGYIGNYINPGDWQYIATGTVAGALVCFAVTLGVGLVVSLAYGY